MGFAQEIKDFTAGYDAARDRKIKGMKAKTEWEKIRPIKESDIDDTTDPIEGGGSGAKIQRVDGEGGGTGTGSTTGLDGKNDVETEKIAGRLKHDLMKDFGLNDIGAGGVVASLASESGGFKLLQELNPTVEGSKGGWGYAQWTGPRRKQFEDFIAENKLDPKSYEANYGFLKHELEGPEGQWLAGLNEAKDYHDATQMFTGSAASKKGFLRPGTPNMSGRFKWADRVAGIEPFEFKSDGTVQTASTDTSSPALAPAKPRQAIPDEVETAGSDAVAQQSAAVEPEQVDIDFGEAPEVALADWSEFAQPTSEWEELQQGGGATMFARRGGVVQHFAEGGIPDDQPPIAASGMPQGVVNARAAGMAPGAGGWAPTAAAGEWRPRRVGLTAGSPGSTTTPPAPTSTDPSAVTSSQQALKDARANRAAQQAAADKAAADKAAADALAAAAAKKKSDPTMLQQLMRAKMLGARIDPSALDSLSDRDYTTWMTGMGRSSGGFRPGTGHGFAEGGAVPDPDDDVQNFARGGVVKDRDAEFQRLLKEESRGPNRGGQDARDRAARRLSQLEGRASSTAYSPSKDPDLFTPAKPRKTKRVKKDPIETGSTDKRNPDRTKDDRVIREPRTKDDTAEAVGGPNPDRTKDDRVIKEPRTKDDKVERVDPDRTKDDRVIKEPRTKDDRAIPEPNEGPYARPDARGTLPLETKPAQKYPRPGLEPQRPASREPVPAAPRPYNPRTTGGPELSRPDARTQPGAREPVSRPPGVPPAGLPRPDASAAQPPVYPPQHRTSVAPPGVPPVGRPPLPRPDPTAAQPMLPPGSAPAANAIAASSAGPRGAVHGGDAAPGQGQPRPDARLDPNTDVFTWRDFLNIFMDDSYKGPDGEGVQFAEGGAVPDDEDDLVMRHSQRDPGYTTSAPGATSPSSALQPGRSPAGLKAPADARLGRSAPAPAEVDDTETASVEPQQRAAVRASPQLMTDVRQALDGGVNFLQRHFGIGGGDGAMPTPEDGAARQAGMQRFASGEGAATPDELEGVDDKIDPNRELDEGQRQMVRLAKTMRWYQARGRKDEAEAAAASYMQYGANRFSKLGTLAEVAYSKYLETNDPSHLDKTAQLIEQAYAMVPDGAEVDIRINEKTGRIEATHVDEDGEETFTEVDPNDIPGLIKGVRDKSMYWNSVFRLADPEGAKSKDITDRTIATEKRGEAAEIRDEGRSLQTKLDEEGRTQKQKDADYKRDQEQKKIDDEAARKLKLEDEDRANKEHDRQALLAAGIARAQKQLEKRDDVNMNALSGTLAEISRAEAAEDEPARDAALSKLWDALPADKERGKLFKDMTGLEGITEFNYAPTATGPTKPANLPEGGKLVKGKKSGRSYWAVPDPNKPGEWLEFTPGASG